MPLPALIISTCVVLIPRIQFNFHQFRLSCSFIFAHGLHRAGSVAEPAAHGPAREGRMLVHVLPVDVCVKLLYFAAKAMPRKSSLYDRACGFGDTPLRRGFGVGDAGALGDNPAVNFRISALGEKSP